MKIDGNEKEKKALKMQKNGQVEEGLALQEEFVIEFREAYNKKDHCSCLVVCKYHGNCKECIAIHRGHRDHIPNCLHSLVNEKMNLLSEITEHTIANDIQSPKKALSKEM